MKLKNPILIFILFIYLSIPTVFALSYDLSTKGSSISGGGIVAWDPCAKPRSYKACVTGYSCFIVDQPRKGQNFTSYFTSLNITDEYIYGMLQFDGCWGLPEDEWLNTLGKDNFTLFDAMGDHTFFFKAPRSVLTTKSYDFIRWAGVVEIPELKIESELRGKKFDSDEIIITAFEHLPSNRITEIQAFSDKIININDNVIVSKINSNLINRIASLNIVRKIEKRRPVIKELDRSAQVIASDYVINLGSNDASGVTVGIIDDGIQQNHSHFSGITVFISTD